MKKINLVNIQLPDKTAVLIRQRKYSVFLGNEKTFQFTNMKEAKRFLAETNRFLNDVLQQCNWLFVFAFSEYRRTWFYFNARITYKYVKLDSLEKTILENIRTIDYHFNIVVTRSHFTNGNYFAFQHLNNIIKAIDSILNCLEEILKERNLTDGKQIMFNRNVLKELTRQLKNYPDI